MGLILKPQARRDRGARAAWDGLLNALQARGWIVAYDAGQPLPDMPDGTPYDGGYQWTKARQAVTRG